jgi:predicted dehydrogenase
VKQVLVVGAGLIGARHVQAVLAHPACDLAGVVDLDPSRRAAVDAPGFDSIEAVNVPVDGAIIASPTGLHLTHARFAAARGWDLLIEKPVAGTMAEANALVAVTRDVATLVGHHRRYHASVSRLKALIAEGRIGTPVVASVIWAMKKPDPYFQNWRDGAGGSPVMINLVHDIDLLRFFLGDVTSVAAVGSSAIRKANRTESGVAVLQFASGASASIAFADTTPSPWGFEAGTGENPNIATTGQDMMWIIGTGGGVSFPSMRMWTGASDWSQAPVPEAIKTDPVVPLTAQLDHFVEVMDRRAEPLISADDGRRTLAVALQIEAVLTDREMP